MLRITTAILAVTLMSGAAFAAPNDATSETDAIQLDQGNEPFSPGSSMKKNPNTSPDPAAQKEMQESDIINQ